MAEQRVGVKSYQRRSKSGKVVHVESYQQKRDQGTQLLRMPGRPQMGASAGQYGAGRSIPGQGVPQAKAKAKPAPGPTKQELDEARKTVERAGMKTTKPLGPKVTDAVKKLQRAGHTVEVDKEKAKAKLERAAAKKASAARPVPKKAVDSLKKKVVSKPPTKKSVAPSKEPKSSQGTMTDAEFEQHTTNLQKTVAKLNAEGKSTDAVHTVDADRMAWTEERAKIHKEIIDDILKANMSVPKDRKAVMAGGLGGAGKTTVLTKFAGIDTSQYVTLNPDEIKEELVKRNLGPETPGGFSPMEMSALLHEESSHLTKMLAAIVQDEGYNVMWDITMSGSAAKTQKKIQDLKDRGYDVQGVFVDIPVETSVERAMQRYRRGLEQFRAGKGLGGRYVPPEIIRQNASDTHSSTNRAAFESVQGEFFDWSIFDNSTYGSDPKLLSSKSGGSQNQLKGKAGTKTSAAASDKLGLAAQVLLDLVRLTG
jgi:predicted ABC-type ATPase